jgi:hypothetical protein
MKDDYFDIEKLMDESSDKVNDELDNLNNEVCRITNGVGSIRLMPVIGDEEKVLFRNYRQVMDETYYLVFCYTNEKTNSQVRNKFAVLSYAETYPVLIKSLKSTPCPEMMVNSQKELHEYLKELVNDESVLRSVRMAMRQGEKKKKDN